MRVWLAIGVSGYLAIGLSGYGAIEPSGYRAIDKTLAQDWRGPALASFDMAWQTISDSFYDPAFGGLDWGAVRAELRPRAEAATSPDAVRKIITSMLARLKRSHFVLMPASGSAVDSEPAGDATVPIGVRVLGSDLIIVAVEPGSTAERAGLRPGQVIQAIDDVAIASWVRDLPAVADPRVRSLELWRRALRAFRGVERSSVELRVADAGRTRHVRVERALEPGERVSLGYLAPFSVRVVSRALETASGRPVGLIGFNVWMAAINGPVARAVDEHRQARGIVIDLRGNPGGLAGMIGGIAGHLLDEPVVLGYMKTRSNPEGLVFKANPRRSTDDGRSVTPFAGPVALLVDELTGSASECFVAALQSLGRARVFGRRTLGQALPASTTRLPNGDVLMYVVGDFVTATGVRVEGGGVVPDEVVPLTIGPLRAGRDPVLEGALAWLDRAK